MRLSKSEWVLLAGVAILAVSLTVPPVLAFRTRKLAASAREGGDLLLRAGAEYRMEYGVWPTRRGIGRGDVRFGRRGIANREVVNALRALEGKGNEGHASNPRRIEFLRAGEFTPGRAGLDEHGDFLDPWGTPYQVVLDTDMNGVCDVADSIYGGGIDGGMLVWSCGPDRKSDTGDDVVSWKGGD